MTFDAIAFDDLRCSRDPRDQSIGDIFVEMYCMLHDAGARAGIYICTFAVTGRNDE
jgi:hypothetical protein